LAVISIRVALLTSMLTSKKFYGNFNNIMSVLGYNRNDISAVHLLKSYCLPSILYNSEIWSLSLPDYLS